MIVWPACCLRLQKGVHKKKKRKKETVHKVTGCSDFTICITSSSGPVNLDDDERVFNSGEMGGFIPTNIDMKKEETIVNDKFL